MTVRFRPVARTGWSDRTPSEAEMTFALAGSRTVWFDSVDVLGPDGAVVEEILAAELIEDVRTLLSVPRAPVCGLSLDRPRVMGILNLTPDSFSDGGDLTGPDAAVERAVAMARYADILDLGGESTRPGAAEVPVDEEIARTAPVIRAIRAAGLDIPISIDTRKAAVASAAIEAGATMVNDVTALRFDPDMARVVAQAAVPVVLMHSVADPATMQKDPRYDNVVTEVYDHLAERISAAIEAGIDPDNILVDPGIGFGKTLQHNLSLLGGLSLYHDLGVGLLLGASRKKFIGTIGRADAAKDRLGGSVAVALHGAAQGVQMLRVHDARETRQAIDLFEALNGKNDE